MLHTVDFYFIKQKRERTRVRGWEVYTNVCLSFPLVKVE